MAWTAPRTWTIGELVTKTILDTHVRDNFLYLKGNAGDVTIEDDVIIQQSTNIDAFIQFKTNSTIRGYIGWDSVDGLLLDVGTSTFGNNMRALSATPGTNGDTYLTANRTVGFRINNDDSTDGVLVIETGAGPSEVYRFTHAGMFFVKDTSNANMTQGITINQGGADNEILALKSSDVSHAMTSLAEADTYATFVKHTAASGGFILAGYSAATTGAQISGLHTTDDTTKSTSGVGAIIIAGALRSGTSVTTLGANANILVVRNQTTTRFILDADGDSHQDAGRTLRAAGGAADDTGVGWTNYDSIDDLAALNSIAVTLSRPDDPDPIRSEFAANLHKHRSFVEAIPGKPLVSFNDGPGGDGRPFVNMSRLTMLHTGAIRQLGVSVGEDREELQALRTRVQELERRLLPA